MDFGSSILTFAQRARGQVTEQVEAPVVDTSVWHDRSKQFIQLDNCSSVRLRAPRRLTLYRSALVRSAPSRFAPRKLARFSLAAWSLASLRSYHPGSLDEGQHSVDRPLSGQRPVRTAWHKAIPRKEPSKSIPQVRSSSTACNTVLLSGLCSLLINSIFEIIGSSSQVF